MPKSEKMSLKSYVSGFTELLGKIDPAEVEALAGALEDAYREGRTVFLIGNGGSGSAASHFCEDLGKGTLVDFDKQKRLRVMSLTDNAPYILAWANDVGYDCIFSEQLKNLAREGDLLVAISGSGNSPNVLKAVEYAHQSGMRTFGITGFDGGRLRKEARQSLHVPSFNMGAVEAAHAVVFHYLLDALRERFKPVA
jgi:D-sedoheptulose 7-phosphate isomerase